MNKNNINIIRRLVKFISVVVFGFVLTACNGQSKSNAISIAKSGAKIEVIDFHSTHRCMTCNAIEANTKYTLETYFSKELKGKKITFQSINVDEKANEKVAEKFEASGTSLFLNIVKNGKEKQVDLTDFAFMNGTDKEKFSTGLKAKIEAELKTL